MKKLIILLSIACAASSVPAHASKPAQQTPSSSGKSWLGPVLMGGGAAIGIGSYLLQRRAQRQNNGMQIINPILLSLVNEPTHYKYDDGTHRIVINHPSYKEKPAQSIQKQQEQQTESSVPSQPELRRESTRITRQGFLSLDEACTILRQQNHDPKLVDKLNKLYQNNTATVDIDDDGFLKSNQRPYNALAIVDHLHRPTTSSKIYSWTTAAGTAVAGIGAFFTFKK